MRAATEDTTAPKPGVPSARPRVVATDRQLQELWFALARTEWTSLALVPVDEGRGTPDVARALAEVGSRVRELPVRALVVGSPEFESSIDLASAARLAGGTAGRGASALPQVIFTVEPVIHEPMGLAVVQAVDAVLLCVQLGRARLEAVNRSLALIGRDRLVGCLVMHASPRWGRSR